MSINLPDLKGVVRKACNDIGLASDVAVALVTGTAFAESRASYLKQVGGPALGLFQMEPATHDDIWSNFLVYRHDLDQKVTALCGTKPSADRMIYDLLYAAAMCRVHYFRCKDPLPADKDYQGMAEYHKRVYNTWSGKAQASANVDYFLMASQSGEVKF